jgi:hypothetical protein
MTNSYKIGQILKKSENLETKYAIHLKKPNSFNISEIKNLILLKNKINRNNKNLISNNKIFQKQAFIFKKSNIEYEQEFQILREKVINYLQKNSETNNIIPLNTKIYVPVYKNKNEEDEVITAYPSILYYRLNERNLSIKQTIQNVEEQFKYRNTYFRLLFTSSSFRKHCSRRARYELLFNIQKQKSLLINQPNSLSRYYSLLRIIRKFYPNEKIKLQIPSAKILLSERNWMKKNLLVERSLVFPKNQSLGQIPIVIGFLNKSDAEIYKKQIIKNYSQKNINRRRIIAKKNERILNCSIKIKRTILSNIQYFFNNFEDVDGDSISNSFILVPKFFTYSGKRKRKHVRIDIPILMLSRYGFGGIPVYKTKEISKKFLLSNQKNCKELSIPKKYFKTKTIFITLNKNEYEQLAKIDKKNKIFYEFEEEEERLFTDSFKKIIKENNKSHLKQFKKILIKIKNKIKTPEKLKLLKQFIFDNYNENNLLEKTSYYIDKINKQNLKQNLN